MILLENSKVIFDVHIDSLYYPVVSGSSVHDEYQAFDAEIDAIYKKLNSLWTEFQQADSRGDTAIANEIETQMETLYETVEATQLKFLDENPASYVAPFVAQSLHYQKEAKEIEELLAKLDPMLDATTLVASMKKRVEVLKSVAVGKTAPDFTQNDPEGNPISLSSLKGSYLLIDFWASWCGPCRRENPNIVRAYEKYHDKGFEILGVSLDNSRENWLRAIEDDKLTWYHVSDLGYWSNQAAALYGISSIPSSLLLDPEGVIIAKNLKGKDLHEELEKLLAP
jgi:peroxiredoxin